MTQQVKLLLEMLVSHIGVLIQYPVTLHPIQLPADVSWEAEDDGLSTTLEGLVR